MAHLAAVIASKSLHDAHTTSLHVHTKFIDFMQIEVTLLTHLAHLHSHTLTHAADLRGLYYALMLTPQIMKCI